MALRSAISSRVPIIIILGATGTGKTKLSVELGQKYKTEIVSADSMQVYKGLDVVTAKATQHERSLVPHHLLDVLEPHHSFTVVDFRNRALKIINSLIEQEKVPIVVGGTHYYMESITWNILVEDDHDTGQLLSEKDEDRRRKRQLENPGRHEDEVVKKPNLNEDGKAEAIIKDDMIGSNSKKDIQENAEESNTRLDKEMLLNIIENRTQFSNEEIHEKLKAIDPKMADRLHPNNRRKVLRAIEVWVKSGRRHSEVLAEQRSTEGHLRRPGATVVFWLKCQQDVHDKRLDARVDAMLEQGLLQELSDFHERHNKQRLIDGQALDYTKGVYQTLGFKEFHEYLMLSEEERASERGQNVLRYSIENMKMATRRYARRQNKMVLSRFLEHPTRQIPFIYDFDTSDTSRWDETVKNKAFHIINSFMENTPCQYETLQPSLDEETKAIDGNSSNFCEVCQRIIIGDKTYKIHLQSNKHKRVLKKLGKLEKPNNN